MFQYIKSKDCWMRLSYGGQATCTYVGFLVPFSEAAVTGHCWTRGTVGLISYGDSCVTVRDFKLLVFVEEQTFIAFNGLRGSKIHKLNYFHYVQQYHFSNYREQLLPHCSIFQSEEGQVYLFSNTPKLSS